MVTGANHCTTRPPLKQKSSTRNKYKTKEEDREGEIVGNRGDHQILGVFTKKVYLKTYDVQK